MTAAAGSRAALADRLRAEADTLERAGSGWIYLMQHMPPTLREAADALAAADAELAQARLCLYQHHALHNLSEEAIRESLGGQGQCQICARVLVGAGAEETKP